ncbi:putative gamma-glutamyltransferase YwrD [Rhodococcus erythropolis]|jgi:gamma-glutamyltranspeptidase/glutathione hydrolase|uniref:gamma-glutamyltransferase family protein n=1 Tax=Rhodococcus erythropolis TaxID=1833 RepID=UPI000BB2FB3E|nr:gamma-glutamyltransferase [Rhodococcus erythropolis]PBI97366.1 putative gamma-glutamyltransferase YwrD [Rhodococcus erythropolis]
MSDRPSGTHHVAIAAPHGAAIDAARTVLEAGGNAVDAAVAAAAALTVVYPHMCSVGGDVIAVLRRPDGTQICINASGAYGSGSPVTELFESMTSMPISGPLTVSVPGAVSGWTALLDTGGSLPASTVLAPAIKLAEEGVPVSPGLAESIEIERESLWADPGMRAKFFLDDGRPVPAGHLLVQPELARTLRDLAQDGLDSFYRGRTAARVASGLQKLGVPVTRDDLYRHHPTIEPPLVRDFAGFSVSTAPPNSQGYTLLRSLGAALVGSPSPTSIDAGVLAEIFYDSDEHRDTYLADPRHTHVDIDELLTVSSDTAAFAQAAARLAGAPRLVSAATPRPGGDTVGIAAVSRDGTAVSLIQSVFHSFGSLLLEPDTGLVLHNRAAFFTLDTNSPNHVEVGKRPAHTLVPVIATFDDGTVAAHGTMGGKAQSQIHTQLILRALSGLSAQATVSAPRFIVGGLEAGTTNDKVLVEPTLEQTAVEQINRSTLTVTTGHKLDSNAGHSMVARVTADGALDAGADPRSDGAALVFE